MVDEQENIGIEDFNDAINEMKLSNADIYDQIMAEIIKFMGRERK